MKALLLIILTIFVTSCADSGETSSLVLGDSAASESSESTPRMTLISATSKTYLEGETLSILINFNKVVNVTGTPSLTIKIGGSNKVAPLTSGSGSTVLTFDYVIVDGDEDIDGIELLSFDLAGAEIKDIDSIDATTLIPAHDLSGSLVKTSVATVNSLTAPAVQTYILNEVLIFDIEFTENVNVSGSPQIEFTTDIGSKIAPLTTGNGSTTLRFEYTVVSNDIDSDGILFDAFNLNGATIQDDAGIDADLSGITFNLSSHFIDAIVPTIDSLDINGVDLYTNSASATLNLTHTNASEMYISATDATCATGGVYEAVSASKSLTLSANVINDLYIKVKDANGNESSCSTVSITHDDQTPNPVATVNIANDASDIATDSSSWTAVSDNGPAGVETYLYAVSTTADDLNIISGGTWASTTAATSFQIDSGVSLTGGVDYFTIVSVVDLAGNISAYTASAVWRIIVSPEVVLNLEASNKTSESISLGWSYPDDNGTAITDYEIKIKGGAYSDWTILADGVSTQTSSTISSLDPETSYEFQIRAFNGINYSGWSNTLTVVTLPNIEFFAPGFKAINISGALKSQLVSFDDDNDIYFDGTLEKTLDKGETYPFNSTEFMEVEGTKAFFVAGKLGTGSGSQDQANVTWATQSWVGDEFYFNLTRSAPLKVKVFAFTDSDITIKSGATTKATQTVLAGTGHTFSFTEYLNYQMSSTGLIAAFIYGNQSGGFYDPQPLLPVSTDILGIPSKKAMVTSGLSSNSYTYYHSNGVSSTGTLSATATTSLNPQGTSGAFAAKSLRLISTTPIVANSNADGDGYCQAPFVPVSMLKKRFGLNVGSNWIALASDRPVTVTLVKPDTTTVDITLTRSGSGKTPFQAYITTDYPAGTILEGDDKFQAWYQPYTSTYSGGEDETIMFGWDE